VKWDPEVAAALVAARRLYARTPDPALVHAVIQKETLHGLLPITGTREPNGHYSYGPMQVEDTTAAMHGIQDPSTLAIPSVGIRVGTFELSRLLTLFGGDVARAVSGYNAGAANAKTNATTGFYPNQSYVDAVLGFWRQYGPAIAGGAGVGLVLALAAGVYLLAARQRRAAA
jgi:soluble lytic murein transglycosylase-like protein